MKVKSAHIKAGATIAALDPKGLEQKYMICYLLSRILVSSADGRIHILFMWECYIFHQKYKETLESILEKDQTTLFNVVDKVGASKNGSI